MKKKKYPVLWWGNTVAIMAVWIEIGVFVVLGIFASIIDPHEESAAAQRTTKW